MIIIAFEGIDGSGKTTLSSKLATVLEKNYKVISYKEPGRTVPTEFYKQPKERQAEFFLDSMAEIDLSDQNTVFILDRWFLSTVVYQGRSEPYNPGVPAKRLCKMIGERNLKKPDIVFYCGSGVPHNSLKKRKEDFIWSKEETSHIRDRYADWMSSKIWATPGNKPHQIRCGTTEAQLKQITDILSSKYEFVIK